MKRVFNKAKNHNEADKWDIYQHINLKPSERQKISKELKRKFYGSKVPDVRESRNNG